MTIKKGFYRISYLILMTMFTTMILEASEKDLYDFSWLDSDKKIYVLQNKVYKKSGRHYLGIGSIINSSSKYQDIYGLKFSYTVYFSEGWGFRLFYNQYKGRENTAAENLKAYDNITPFTRKLDTKKGIIILWSPFYGKLNIFNKIIYVDWFFGMGGGIIEGQDNAETIVSTSSRDIFAPVSDTAIMTNTGICLYLGQSFNLNLTYHFDLYNARDVYKENGEPGGKSLTSNKEVSLSLGMRL
ncbi:MAG: hypothetical protein OXB84_01960 [Halobacteriovoraceae bacterium]|nr:hypothetical protein [Halobacteriovoraceae bacterium]